ncbi:MAG: hypothetical protein EWM50_07570, partial [Gottschalkiaceae bacterium]
PENNYFLFIEEDSERILFASIYGQQDIDLAIRGEVQILEEKPNLFKRIDGLVPLEKMNEKAISIIGLGSGGSSIAMELAAAGVGKLYLFDKDRLDNVNIFRHICGERDLGRKKTDAVEDVIKDHSLPTKIKKYNDNIVYNPEKLIESIQCCDVVICATDNPESRSMVNYLCVKLRKTLVLVCTFDNAKIGEIIRVMPEQTACYECTRIHLKEQGVLIEDIETREGVLPYGSQAVGTDNNSMGTRTDVFIVAAMAAKVALMTLNDDTEKGFGRLPYNYITWGAVRNTEFSGPYTFKQPFATSYGNYNIRQDCPICGSLNEELININIEEKYNEIMQTLST